MPSHAVPPTPTLVRPAWSATVARPLAALALIGVAWAYPMGQGRSDAASREPGLSAAAAVALRAQGFIVSTADVHWIDPPSQQRRWLGGSYRYVVVAQRPNEPTDVWLGVARLSPEGRWLSLAQLYNLSDTSAVAETDLTVSDQRIAWHVRDAGEVVAIKIVDLAVGQALNSDATRLERWQLRLTALQETGQLAGWCKRAYRLAAPRTEVTSTWTSEGLQVESLGKSAILRCDGTGPNTLGIAPEPSDVGSPGDLLTWTVDRVRALPWFGTDRMQWVKAIAFNALDRLDSVKRRVIKSDGLGQLNEEVGGFLSSEPVPELDPQSDWPPPALTPLVTPALPSEGVFRSLNEDPFAVPPWGGRSPFAFTFLRPEPARPESQIFIVAWDPKLLELHTMTGTREPKTATGETGSGTVPREDGTVARLAGAFNGGFQATHGEYGMMAQRIVYLPPKPFGATIAEQVDGSVGFGTWPNDDSIPDGMIGFRQNLTPLIADGVVNPYRRTWWGGVPPGWEDATRTVRTGLCLTKDNFVAYFYGSTINSDHLSKAMVAARCTYGVHLDMNPGHTGFEFYRVGKRGILPTPPRKLDANWETRGSVPGAPDLEFLGRRMLRTMHLMHFPRYVRTDSRDFFYLTHRYVLPPPAATQQSARSTAWQTKEYAQQGSPPAFATAKWRPDPARPELEIAMLVLDAKWAKPCKIDCGENTPLVRMHRTGGGPGRGIYYLDRRFTLTEAQPPSGAIAIAFGKDAAHGTRATGAIGIAHHDWLYYVEVVRGGDRQRDAPILKGLLLELGCDDVLLLEQSIDVSIGNGDRSHRHADVTWQRDASPFAVRVFPDTGVVAPEVWQPLQNKRVRYVRQRPAPLSARPAPAGNDTTNVESASPADSPVGDDISADSPPQ